VTKEVEERGGMNKLKGHCNVLQHSATQCNRAYFMPHLSFTVAAVAALVSVTATDYNRLQLTTTSCNVK